MADNQPSSLNPEVETDPASSNNSSTAETTETTETTETQPNGSSSSSSPIKTCSNCNKPESDPEKPLKPCSKCQSVQYCSRDCQKADFKKHKKICASAAQAYAQTADIKLAAPRAPKKDGHRGGLQKWQFDT